jgi:isocitrate dehydrogenase kinase/phosphatase
MASQPWYYVGPKDIFPEEFPGFLMRAGPHLTYLRQIHGEIFDADFWNDVKARLLAGRNHGRFPLSVRSAVFAVGGECKSPNIYPNL